MPKLPTLPDEDAHRVERRRVRDVILYYALPPASRAEFSKPTGSQLI